MFPMTQEAEQIKKKKVTFFMECFVISVKIPSYEERQLY